MARSVSALQRIAKASHPSMVKVASYADRAIRRSALKEIAQHQAVERQLRQAACLDDSVRLAHSNPELADSDPALQRKCITPGCTRPASIGGVSGKICVPCRSDVATAKAKAKSLA